MISNQKVLQQLYRWHRTIGLLIVLPILGWCISGLTHPMMAHFFKIKPAQRKIPPRAIQLDSAARQLPDLLVQYNIKQFTNIAIVNYKNANYYQIHQAGAPARYIHCQTGLLLNNGDLQYAETLARFYLGDSSSLIKGVERLNHFTGEYKFINRLLPVYKVSFDRADAMDVYVATQSSRLGTLNNNTRKACLSIFSNLHNWSFLDAYPLLKRSLLLLFMGLGFWVALSGLLIYGFLWDKIKASRPKNAARPWHRRLGLAVALSTLGFTFSGGYHAFVKPIKNKQLPKIMPIFNQSDVTLFANLWDQYGHLPIHQVSLADLDGEVYYRLQLLDKKQAVLYVHTKRLEVLKEGQKEHAIYLASQYSKLPVTAIQSVESVYKFGGEYGFINKRLPVSKVSYKTAATDHVYVETSSGALAAAINNSKRNEAFSFLMLHKYHFLDPISKLFRDVMLVLIILCIMLVNLLGVYMWWRKT